MYEVVQVTVMTLLSVLVNMCQFLTT